MAARAARRNPRRQWAEMDILLLGETAMAEANRQFLRHTGTTDVITLVYRPMSKEDGWRGEVLINLDLARRLGSRHGGAGRELALYLAHGMNHLSGAHDRTPAERRRMRQRDLRWRAEAFSAGGLHGLERWGASPSPRRPALSRTAQC